MNNKQIFGGNTYNEPQDHGFMYSHGYQDLDGHIWEVLHLDPSKIPDEMKQTAAAK